MIDPKDFTTVEAFLAAVIAEAMQKWANAGPRPTTQGGDGGGPG